MLLGHLHKGNNLSLAENEHTYAFNDKDEPSIIYVNLCIILYKKFQVADKEIYERIKKPTYSTLFHWVQEREVSAVN